MKVQHYISGDDTRCVQASFRMVVQALTGNDPGGEATDVLTGYVEGRGTWQFRMLLALAKCDLQVVDWELMDVNAFLSDPEAAIRAQVKDDDAIGGILQETDLIAEKEALRACVESPHINFVETIPTFHDLEQEVKSGKLVMANVNLRVLQNMEGREGHMVIIEDITDSEVIVDDPGPRGGLGISIDRSLFQKAWTSPSEAMANFISVSR
jgi:hypothetical protein